MLFGSGLFGLFYSPAASPKRWSKVSPAKNISGNGTAADAHIGLNTDTKIPEIHSIFVSGDFATTQSDTNKVSYREESSASVWKASSITQKRFLSITLTDAGDVPAAIKAAGEVFNTVEKSVVK